MTDRAKFCYRLKQARLEARLKQEVVARYLQIPTSAVSAFESGNRKLEALELYMLSKLYRKPFGWFFEEEGAEPMREAAYEKARNAPQSAGPSQSQHQSQHTMFFPNRQNPAANFEDPLMAECFNLLQRAPLHLQRSAAYGVIGFLSER